MNFSTSCFQTMGEATGVEKEPQGAQNMPPERRVEQMFAALKKHRPVFILVILPTDGSNSALYGSESSSFSLPLFFLERISSSQFQSY